jgi:hypothetical protein
MMTWVKDATFDDKTGKVLYKGIDIGIPRQILQKNRETISDLHIGLGIEVSDDYIEWLYSKNIIIIRDKKIDEILS